MRLSLLGKYLLKLRMIKYLDELKKLELPRDKFSIFGSGCLAIKNIRENNGIDLIVKRDLWEKLVKKYPDLNDKNSIEIGNIEISESVPYVEDIDKLIDDSDIIEGIRFIKLSDLLEWKKKMGREKDLRDVELILDCEKKAEK